MQCVFEPVPDVQNAKLSVKSPAIYLFIEVDTRKEYGPWDMALGGDMNLAKGYESPMGDLSVGELGSSPIGGSREARRRAVKRETRKFFRRAENRSAGTEVVDGVRMR